MKPRRSSVQRVLYACVYSKDGLVAAFKEEAAFRQELALFVLFLPALYFLPLSPVVKMILLGANSLVLITELVNSSIEAVVDLVSPDHHPLAKNAKDMGSAAVFVSITLAVCLWVAALYPLLQ